jgi:hypothetical protein
MHPWTLLLDSLFCVSPLAKRGNTCRSMSIEGRKRKRPSPLSEDTNH